MNLRNHVKDLLYEVVHNTELWVGVVRERRLVLAPFPWCGDESSLCEAWSAILLSIMPSSASTSSAEFRAGMAKHLVLSVLLLCFHGLVLSDQERRVVALVDSDRAYGAAQRRLDEGTLLVRKKLRVVDGVEPTVRGLPADRDQL